MQNIDIVHYRKLKIAQCTACMWRSQRYLNFEDVLQASELHNEREH